MKLQQRLALLVGGTAIALVGCLSVSDGADVDAATEPYRLSQIQRIISSLPRSESQKDDDRNRHPAEIVHVSGVGPGDWVLDLYPGEDAYYGQILTTLVGPSGRVIGVTPPSVVDVRPVATNGPEELAVKFSSYESLISDFDAIALERPVDVIWMFNIYHDGYWLGWDRHAVNRRLYEFLKPGGTLVVADHRGVDGAGGQYAQSLHRGDAATTRTELERAGFTLVHESDVLANPDDDPLLSVFDPSVRGRTDQFVYVFRKPR